MPTFTVCSAFTMSTNIIGGVDIGGTKIAVGAVDRTGRVLAKLDATTGPNWEYEQGLALTADMLRSVASMAGVRLSGVGIGSTGPVDPIRGRFEDIDFLPRWRGKDVVDDLTQMLKVSIALENDADAAALGEARWGAGKHSTRLIYVTVGTGIGGGIILDGKLYRGVDGAHPEIGHHVIDPAGPLCSCGFHGCWESIAAGPGMAAWFHSQASPEPSASTAKDIYDLAARGHALALAAVQRENFYLGVGLANIINLFAPERIVLGGSVMKGASRYLDEIRQALRLGCRFVPLEKTSLTLASLGDDANLIGAASAWHHRFGVEING
jgi:glucokinase